MQLVDHCLMMIMWLISGGIHTLWYVGVTTS